MSSFEITKVVLSPDLKIFLCIPASAPDAVDFSPSGIKTLLASALIALAIKGSPVLSNGPKKSS